MPCAACIKRGKVWEGGDPKCSFPDGGDFNPDNWNCATANAIRDICGSYFEHTHPESDYRFCDDQNYATIRIDGIDLVAGNALALWVTWYKNRGRTEGMWLLSADDPPRRPTEADCVAIIAALVKHDTPLSTESR